MIRSFSLNLLPLLRGTALRRGAVFGGILVAALLAFELFNYSTTAFALQDVLGDLSFGGLPWATVLAFAFCAIDFAGIARLVTPEEGRDDPAEVWYLFAAWLLAAGFNAVLTWWGVSVAILNHNAVGGALVGQGVLTKAVPVFVAVMVWLVRVLIIGTFSLAGERLFTLDVAPSRTSARGQSARPAMQPQAVRTAPGFSNSLAASQNRAGFKHAPRPEPGYHPVEMSAAAEE